MKRFILSITLSLSILLSFSATGTILKYPVPNVGLTTTIPNVTPLPDVIYVYPSASGVLSGNISLAFSGNPPKGTMIRVVVEGFTLGAQTVTVLGEVFQDYMVSVNHAWVVTFFYTDNAGAYIRYNQPTTLAPNLGASVRRTLDGDIIVSGTLPLSALESPITPSDLDTVGRGRILVGNSSNDLASKFFGTNTYIGIGDGTDYNSVAQSGDVIYSNAGVSAIQAGVIVDADINAAAAITRSKTAVGSANYVLINSAGGVMTEEQYLSASRGGLAQNASAATGFTTWSGGTATIAELTDVRGLDNLSFVTANQGIYYLYFPFAATTTNINCRVTSVVAGTDAGTVEVANNSGTVMAGSSLAAGLLTIASGATFGTGYSSTLTSNNTFTAGQSLRLTTLKTTSGGVLHCDVTYTRNN